MKRLKAVLDEEFAKASSKKGRGAPVARDSNGNGYTTADKYPPDKRGDAYEGDELSPPDPPGDPLAEYTSPKIETYTLADLLTTYPTMREPVIHGLLRVGETMNVIAAPKTGKSWLTTSLAYAVATGTPWLGFSTIQSNVLIIDNELHRETLASRLRRVAEANRIDVATVAERIVIMPLRGQLTNLHALGAYFHAQIPGRFNLVIVDAFYRTLPSGTDENDNAKVAELYNLIDHYADKLRSSFTLIHHASKGNQSQKSITDVGSGAGSHSRAADTHLILRSHAQDDVVVLDAAVRSFPPIAPRCLRWSWPSFTVAEELDPNELRQSGSKGRRSRATISAEIAAKEREPAWDAKRFSDTFVTAEPKTRASILAAAAVAGIADRKAEALLKGAVDREFAFFWPDDESGPRALVSTTRPPQKNQGKSQKASK